MSPLVEFCGFKIPLAINSGIIRAKGTVPEKIGDPVIALFAVKVMSKMALFHILEPPCPRRESQMLDAVAKLVRACGKKPHAHRRRRAREAVDEIADGTGENHDGRQRRVERAEQHAQIVGILMVVEMNALPNRSRLPNSV